MVYKLTYGNSSSVVESNAVVNPSIAKSIDQTKLNMLFEDISLKNHNGILILKRKVKKGYYFGLGDKMGPLNRYGKKYVFWNTDNNIHHPSADPLYKSFPFFIYISEDLSQIYGVFTDHPGWMELDLDSNNSGLISFKIQSDGFIQYILTGNDVKDILNQYLNLTGQNIAFPVYALGYQHSRWGYAKEILKVAKTFREKNIPCDVLYLDIDYMDNHKVFTWNKGIFSNPKNTIHELHEKGFKISIILDPGVKVEKGYQIFEEGKNKYFIKTNDGKDFEGSVWPGKVRFPDFMNSEVRDWWSKKVIEQMEKIGIDGFWNDMNEPSIFATEKDLEKAAESLKKLKLEEGIQVAIKLSEIGEIGKRDHANEMVHLDGTPNWKVKNLYGFNMIRSSSEKIQSQNKRPFLITRSAYSGVQRYGGVWTGDNHSWWEHIFQEIIRLISLSLVGVFYSGADVGGFRGDTNPELLIRFTQFGVFMPMFRNHSEIITKRQNPWSFGKEVEDKIRKAINLRYKLLPYIYTSYMLGILNNEPLIKPLFYHFISKEALNIEDEFLFGNQLLVAPIYRPRCSKRVVWLPKKSINLLSGEIFEAGWHLVDVDLDYIPAFQFIESAIPFFEPQPYINYKNVDKVYWKVFVNEKAEGYFYEDDGITLNYINKNFNLKKVSITKDCIKVETLEKGFQTKYREWIFDIIHENGKTERIKINVGPNDNFSINN